MFLFTGIVSSRQKKLSCLPMTVATVIVIAVGITGRVGAVVRRRWRRSGSRRCSSLCCFLLPETGFGLLFDGDGDGEVLKLDFDGGEGDDVGYDDVGFLFFSERRKTNFPRFDLRIFCYCCCFFNYK